MKSKWRFIGFFSIVVYGVAVCGTVLPTEQVEAKEPEIIIIKDELAVAAADKPIMNIEKDKKPQTEEAYVAVPSLNIEDEVADGRVDESDFTAQVHGIEVKLGSEINDLMNELGAPDSFEEAANSKRDGSNKKYTYKGITIYTNPKNKKDIVNTIEYRGEEKTLSGIGVGSTRADIEAAYGIDYVMDPVYITYAYGENAAISFQMDGEECTYIEFCWK